MNVFLLITPIKIRRSVVTATKAEFLPSAEKSFLDMAAVASNELLNACKERMVVIVWGGSAYL